ncbi:MAG: hypothetical protein V1848_01845 [Candidatus Magasanikbacteria bacterium]
MDEKFAQEAETYLAQNERRRRDEKKHIVEYLILVFLGIIGAALASLSVEVVSNSLSCDYTSNIIFKIGLLSLGASFFLGIIFIFLEEKVFSQDELIKGLTKLDHAFIIKENKPNTYYLALTELTNMRNDIGSQLEERKYFKNAFEAHKKDLFSWTCVKKPEKLYTPSDKKNAQKVFWAFFLSGSLGVLVFLCFFLIIL